MSSINKPYYLEAAAITVAAFRESSRRIVRTRVNGPPLAQGQHAPQGRVDALTHPDGPDSSVNIINTRERFYCIKLLIEYLIALQSTNVCSSLEFISILQIDHFGT